MSKKLKVIFVSAFVLFALIQVIPVNRNNPESNASDEIEAPPNIKTILKNSCYDCHSNATSWPAYSYIAPVSWLVSRDVEEGRKELNFSEWNTYSNKRKLKKIEEIKEEINEDKMPLPIYTFIHGNAELNEEQKSSLIKWVESIDTLSLDNYKGE